MKKEERTNCSKQSKGNGRIPKNSDVPTKDYDPKNLQDKLPRNNKK